MRVAAYLMGGGDPPPEYIDLFLCRDVFHCTPSELYDEDASVVQTFLDVLDAEGQYQKMKARKKASNRGK